MTAKRETATDTIARLAARVRELETALHVAENRTCEDCGRALAPRALACNGCALDAERHDRARVATR